MVKASLSRRWLWPSLIALVLAGATLWAWGQGRPAPASPPVGGGAAARQPQEPAWTQRRLANQRRRGDYAGQAESLQKLLVLHPGDTKILRELALITCALEPENALAYLNQAATLDEAWSEQARLLADAIRTASYQEEPAYTYLAAGRALASQDEWALAAQAFQRAAALRSDWAEPLAFLGEAQQHGPNPNPAAGFASLQQALKVDPASATTLTFLSFYYQRQGQLDLALKAIQDAIASEPQNPILFVESGKILATQGKLAEAQAAYEQAIAFDEDNPLYWRSLAEFSLVNGALLREVGLPAARQAVLLAPEDPASLDMLGQVFIGLEDYASADKFLNRALVSDPTYLPAQLHLGQCALYQGRLEEAHQLWQGVKAQGPASAAGVRAAELLQQYFP